ncbi:MAG: WG repeat-containing protein [Bacteroidetes bacterium]|nr:WG repeat-containing protein [Bacteroidota bacterium]MBK8658278.1 WG repeat-containing protein [Bacteroidota bacterium]
MKHLASFLLLVAALSLNAQEITQQYDKIDKFDQGVAVMWKNGKCGLVSQTGKEIIKPQFDNIGRFGRDGIAYTHKNGLMGLVNMTGKVIVDNIYGDIGRFNGFWAITRKNGLAGMINKQGKVLIENKYESIKVEKGGIIRGVIGGKEVILTLKDE